jgi:hypothetical protein
MHELAAASHDQDRRGVLLRRLGLAALMGMEESDLC